MEYIIGIIMGAAVLVSIVCWVMVLIKIFKENVGLGILGIVCNLFAFIYGWVRVKEYNCKTIMVVWTITTIVAVVVQMLGGAAIIRQFMAELQSV